MEKICVAVRVRPPAPEKYPENGAVHWKVEDNRISLYKSLDTPISNVSYAFDHVFDETCTNARVYELLTRDIIHAAVDGFNGTAFAYGQTSSGKTFTMKGSETDPGIIHRAVRDVFERIKTISDREFLIRVSYMEIYNEEINDLLAVENQKLQIHENFERGIFVTGLKEEIVNDAEQILKLIDAGEVNRHFGETNMNIRSSRSHTIFRMVIESKGKENSSSDAIRVSVLNLVDLAGSERIAKTGADGVRLKEGKYINKSLMILGNVINKLSDGAKQRAHIPYRDSKLTRILQPALGGNAKTCIICTVAPEEDHIEESKGTLQFASRAKRITNCAQVNEILTDGALLKRQKLEIEELRMKLQGSHAEVLEQEILKLRNQMLKYELECERLEAQLEEERRTQKEYEHRIKEQQVKIDNLSNLVSNSDLRRNQSEEFISLGRTSNEDCNGNDSSEFPDTPCFRSASKSFVVARSNYSGLSDFSPLVDFENVADEDTWMKINKGYKADLDKLQFTPFSKVQSSPSSIATKECLHENYKEDMENLRKQFELLTKERDNLERKHDEQVLLNNQLKEEISELKQEALHMKEVPKRLFGSVAHCRDIYKDVLFTMKSFVPDEESPTSKLLFGTTEVTRSLLSTLETQFLEVLDGQIAATANNCSYSSKDLWETLHERMKSKVTCLLSDPQARDQLLNCHKKGCAAGREMASLEEKLNDELNTIKQKYNELEKNSHFSKQLLEDSKESYSMLEKELQLLKEERDSLVAEASQRWRMVADEKENVLKDLNVELKRRKDMEEEIKQFSTAFANRQNSLMSFHSEFKSKLQKLRSQYPKSP
ncbi:PREDICTED: kinesin-like protein KIN-7N [Tarenaya hassleriana]|uniref:kinesin-like protein KIN-7N n=1 Tax=Tarenaya hassleriana TaxID=28532 RepID=UPI00053C20B0|nr:PREDICTED: kinesin-like protein KIN-7N [Tarenaya hassleriana]